MIFEAELLRAVAASALDLLGGVAAVDDSVVGVRGAAVQIDDSAIRETGALAEGGGC